MALSTPPPSSAELPNLSEEAVQVRMMRELLVRTRESALVGFLPVFLIVWSHWNAQPLGQLWLWAACAWLVLAFRVLIAHLYLIQPQAQEARGRIWYGLEWLGSAGLALVWVGSLTMVGTGQIDPLFYLRLIFLVALVAFLLSALGIDTRLYASFMAILVPGVLFQLHRHYPEFVRELPVVDYAFVVYAVMLLVRSRGDNQTIRQELLMHDALRLKTLELEQTNRKLGELAIHDGLTGALRRGHVEGELRRQVKALERLPADFSVMLMDIDFFKRVNDQHGHAVGDEVLRKLAQQVQSTLRASDLFGRWGGEEFIVLMPGTGMQQAMEAAERVRVGLHALIFEGEDGAPFGITISIGVAQWQPQESADQLAQRADKALYAAKHGGRDRVMADVPGQSRPPGSSAAAPRAEGH